MADFFEEPGRVLLKCARVCVEARISGRSGQRRQER